MVTGLDPSPFPLFGRPSTPECAIDRVAVARWCLLTMGGVCLRAQDKVVAVADDVVVVDGASVGVGDARKEGKQDEEEMAPVEPLPEPPGDGGPVAWPMPDFCPLTVSDSFSILHPPGFDSNPSHTATEDETLFLLSDRQIDGVLKESFLETLRKDAAEMERPAREESEAEEALSPDSRPSSSKRHRAGTASPSSRSSPYRNILQVFQQCRQDAAEETPTKNY